MLGCLAAGCGGGLFAGYLDTVGAGVDETHELIAWLALEEVQISAAFALYLYLALDQEPFEEQFVAGGAAVLVVVLARRGGHGGGQREL